MERKFYDGQWVRVIGADWEMRIAGIAVLGTGSGFDWYYEEIYMTTKWPEYLLEEAE